MPGRRRQVKVLTMETKEQNQQNGAARNGQENRQEPAPSRRRVFLAGILTGVLVTCIAGSAGMIGYRLAEGGRAVVAQADPDTESGSAVNEESVKKLQLLEDEINEYYYESDDVTRSQKEDGLYKGLIESLNDPYSVYYTGEEVRDLSESISGSFYGIGAYISTDKETGYPMIAGVMEDGSAGKAGILPGDLIVEVDGNPVEGESLDEVVSRVRGEEGTSVHLRIYRDGKPDYLEFDIERAKVDETTVDGRMLDKDYGIGYLAISQFDTVTTEQFDTCLGELKQEGLKGLILDLRNNPGGNVDTVTDIAGNFLPEGLVFYTLEKDGTRTDYSCDGKNQLKLPLVVLVNGNSASASEILSGAIQDAGSGTILGTQTYGKGVVQSVMTLNDGSGLKLTIANYFTRNGNNINKIGITPDVELEFDSDAYTQDGSDNQLQRAQELVEEELNVP